MLYLEMMDCDDNARFCYFITFIDNIRKVTLSQRHGSELIKLSKQCLLDDLFPPCVSRRPHALLQSASPPKE